MIKFVCDSTADIPSGLIEEYDIQIVPTHLIWGEEDFLDRVTIQPEEFYRRATIDPVPPTSATPTIGEFKTAYDTAIAKGATEIICMPIGSKLSSTLKIARLTATDYPVPIHVVDTLGTTMLTGWQVLAGARRAAEGGSVDEVLKVIEETRKSVFVLFGLDTLSWVARGGRMGNSFRWLTSTVPIKPVISLSSDKGKFEAIALKRTYKGVKESLLNAFFKRVPQIPRCRLAILHGDALDSALELKDRILEVAQPKELFITSTGPVVGLHTGPKALGLCAHPQV